MSAAVRKLPPIERLSPTVVRVLALNPSPFTLQGTNTYLLGTGSEKILVDTGGGEDGYDQRLSEAMHMTGGSFLSHIIVTHWHKDHMGGVDQAIKSIGSRDTKVHKYFPDPRASRPSAQAHFNALAEGGFLSVEGATLKTICTPGHTKDHMSLWLNEENAIFTGDCVLGDNSTVVFEDLSAYMDSLSRLQALNPYILYPGHGNAIHPAMPRLKEYIAHRHARDNQILGALAYEGQATGRQLAKAIYADTIDAKLMATAANVLLLHLLKLEKEGKVKKQAPASHARASQLKGPGGLTLAQIHGAVQMSVAEDRAAQGNSKEGGLTHPSHAHLASLADHKWSLC